jgi:hypothetical protein
LPVLERAFSATYGIGFKELFGDTDMAIGTFRLCGQPADSRDDAGGLETQAGRNPQLAPAVQPNAFIYAFTAPGLRAGVRNQVPKSRVFARFLGWWRDPAENRPAQHDEVHRADAGSAKAVRREFRETRARYRALIADSRDGRVQLPNTDFDVGRAPRWGDNVVADRAYVALLEKLAERNFTPTPPELRRTLVQFFSKVDASQPDKRLRKKVGAIRTLVARLNSA